jgi:hypothetical protein
MHRGAIFVRTPMNRFRSCGRNTSWSRACLSGGLAGRLGRRTAGLGSAFPLFVSSARGDCGAACSAHARQSGESRGRPRSERRTVTAEHPGWRRLGTVLVDAGLLRDEELAQVLAEQERTGELLGTILVTRGLVSAAAIANALAEQYGGILRSEHGFGTGLPATPERGLPDAAEPVPEPPVTPTTGQPALATPAAATHAGPGHLLFVPTSQGYLLLSRSGAAPDPGQTLELPGITGTLAVVKTASSPLPSDPRRCAYLEIL